MVLESALCSGAAFSRRMIASLVTGRLKVVAVLMVVTLTLPSLPGDVSIARPVATGL